MGEGPRPGVILSPMTDMPLWPSNAPTRNSDAAEHGCEATRPDHRKMTEEKGTPSIEAKKEVPSTTNRHLASSTKLTQACQPEYQSLPTSPGSGDLTSTSQRKLATNSTQRDKPGELMVEVVINGKTMRCLLDTGAAISVLDAEHLAH